MVRVSASLLMVALLAGCISTENEVPAEEGPDAVMAPEWNVGEWWTYRWESEIYGFSFDATVVVGEVSDERFLVGLPVADYSLDALLFHLPVVGPVGRNLTYAVHEVPFEPVRFPLTDGLEWDTQYIALPIHFKAEAALVETLGPKLPGFRITNDGHEAESGRHYRAEYSPHVGWFTMFERVELDGRVRERITLVNRGHDFDGSVQVIDDIRVLFLESRTTGLLGADGMPTAPLAPFDPPDDLDRIFAACLFGDAPGVFDVAVESPDGIACENRGTVTPDDTFRNIRAAEVDNVAGDWTVRLGAAGTGVAVAEVLGYKAWTVELG